MSGSDGSISFYFFDIDDNLLFLPSSLYLWNAESQTEVAISSGEFARIQNDLGRKGKWLPWSAREETFRDFRDRPGIAAAEQAFVKDLERAIGKGAGWQGPSWPLLVHAARNQRPIALVTARGHDPSTIEAGICKLVERGLLSAMPPILKIYSVTNPGVRATLGANDPDMTVSSVKKMAIRDAVEKALQKYGVQPPHRFGMSDDDPNNVVLAISAMRDCKEEHPDKRFIVVNSNEEEFVKLEIFPMAHPVTASRSGGGVLQDSRVDDKPHTAPISGGNASVYITNMDRAVDFYTTKLGLPLRVRIQNEWAEIDAGRGLCHRIASRPPAGDTKTGNHRRHQYRACRHQTAGRRGRLTGGQGREVQWPNRKLRECQACFPRRS
jgi:hypothetical protein